MRLKRRSILAAVGTSAALAGCLGDEGDQQDGDQTDGGNNQGDGGNGESDGETGGGDATVRVRSHSDLGDVLVGPDGMTLYMFDQDTEGEGASTCYDDCAEAWPPLTVDGDPTAGEGVTAELTVFERDDGSAQVAAGGWPLYYFASDESPGDAVGQGVNDVWWVLRPDGSPVKPGTGDDGGSGNGDGESGNSDGGSGSGDGGSGSGGGDSGGTTGY